MSQEALQRFLADYQKTHAEIYQGKKFEEYLRIVSENPKVLNTAHQRIFEMICSFGSEKTELYPDISVTHYKLLDDPLGSSRGAVFGLDEFFENIVSYFRAAAHGLNMDRRVLVLYGPSGSAKNSILDLLRRGLEHYSETKEGSLYTLFWKDEGGKELACPKNEDPIFLLPKESRGEILAGLLTPEALAGLHSSIFRNQLCSFCLNRLHQALAVCEGDLKKVLEERVVIRRLLISEKEKRGMNFFQPKESMEKTATTNLPKEILFANRGLIELVEPFQLDQESLHHLNVISQERKAKDGGGNEVDCAIIAHTNHYPSPEDIAKNHIQVQQSFEKRCFPVLIPYPTRISEERKIYKRDYGAKLHTPHTLNVASELAVMTRVNGHNEGLTGKGGIDPDDMMDLFNGEEMIPYKLSDIKELRRICGQMGMAGISPREIQNLLEELLAKAEEEGRSGCVTPIAFLNALDKKDDNLDAEREIVKRRYNEKIKEEVKLELIGGEDAFKHAFTRYKTALKAHTLQEKVKDNFSGKMIDPEEILKEIEQYAGIPISDKERQADFRNEILRKAIEDDREFTYRSNKKLYEALLSSLEHLNEKFIDELVSLGQGNVPKVETKKRLEEVKERLKKKGYKECCAGDVIMYVAELLADNVQELRLKK